MRLILIRHGASLHAQRGIIANGASCPGLTDAGFEQVQRLADRLCALPDASDMRTILSSPALRALQTAEVIARALKIAPILQDDDLTEIRPGVAEGLTAEAYQAQYGAFDWTAEPARPFAPGGESWNAFIARVQAALSRLAETYDGQTVLAATHAGFIVAAFRVLFDIAPRAGDQTRRGWLDPMHTGLTEWQVSAGRWTLVRYNDTAHLSRQ